MEWFVCFDQDVFFDESFSFVACHDVAYLFGRVDDSFFSVIGLRCLEMVFYTFLDVFCLSDV
jgi:hypothetical protein